MRHFIIAVFTAVLFVAVLIPTVSSAQERPNTGVNIPDEKDDGTPTSAECGNKKCEKGESYTNCPDDCKKPTPKGPKAEEAPPPAAPTVVEVDLTPVIILLILLALISIAALIFALVAFMTARSHRRAISHLIRHLPQEELHG